MKTVANRIVRVSALLGITAVWASTTAAAPQQGGESARGFRVPSYRRDLNERYAPLYRSSPLDSSSRLDALRRSYRYRPSYRRALPLNRSDVYRSWPPNYYRRATPYYDGRGYGVPSTSPYRFHPDLDRRIRPWRRR